MATGSIDGEVCVWDFEMSKLEGICIGHTGDITGIEFLTPHPLMITSSMDGSLCIWGLRTLSIHHKYVCLYRFSNYSWNFQKEILCPITQIKIKSKSMQGIKRHKRIKEGLFTASKYGSFNVNFLFSQIENKVKREMTLNTDKKSKEKDSFLLNLLRN